jgi:hypothetical protein
MALPPLISQRTRVIGVSILVVAVVAFAIYRHQLKAKEKYDQGLAADRLLVQTKIKKVNNNPRLKKVKIEPVEGEVEGHFKVTGTVETPQDEKWLYETLMQISGMHDFY